MVYCIGLTGSIASGKTTVSQFFLDLGAEVISADVIAKELTTKGQPAYHKILSHFGTEVHLSDGSLDRKRLRDIIFSNATERQWLENLLHPLIRDKITRLVTHSTKIYSIVEIPLLVDKTLYPYLDQVLVITAPFDVQIARVMDRDQCSREQALAILAAQPELSIRLKYANDVLVNDMNLFELRQAVECLHHKYLRALNLKGND